MVRSKVVRKINDFDAKNHKNLKFLLHLGAGDVEELISCVELNGMISDMIDDEEAN